MSGHSLPTTRLEAAIRQAGEEVSRIGCYRGIQRLVEVELSVAEEEREVSDLLIISYAL